MLFAPIFYNLCVVCIVFRMSVREGPWNMTTMSLAKTTIFMFGVLDSKVIRSLIIEHCKRQFQMQRNKAGRQP